MTINRFQNLAVPICAFLSIAGCSSLDTFHAPNHALVLSGRASAVSYQKVLKLVHEAAEKRAQGHIEAEIPEHESEAQALTEASQTDG